MAKVIDYQLIFYGDAMELESQVRNGSFTDRLWYFGQSVGQALIKYETEPSSPERANAAAGGALSLNPLIASLTPHDLNE